MPSRHPHRRRCGAAAPASFCPRCGQGQEYPRWRFTPSPMLVFLGVCCGCGLRLIDPTSGACPRCLQPRFRNVPDPNRLVRLGDSIITAVAFVIWHMRGR